MQILQRLSLSIVGLALLAACGNTTSQTPTAAPSTAAPVATIAPTAEPTVAATAEPTAAPTSEATAEATAEPTAAPVSQTRVFEIVSEQTTASYQVQEQFLSQSLPIQAIGRTSEVSGEFEFSLDGQPTGQVSKITVDLSTLRSDSSRRDDRIKTEWLESSTYPLAEFTSTEVIGAPSSYTDGEQVTFQLVGDLTIRDITKSVTFDVTGVLNGDTVTGSATGRIMMVDFGFDPPSIVGMLTVEDGVTITIDFTAKEKAAQ